MNEITVDIPEDALEALKASPELAGAAARLADVPRTVFLTRLSDYGVDAFTLDETDLDVEIRLA